MLDLKPKSKSVLVWDVTIRVFHWSFATLIVATWLTRELHGPGRGWHIWMGYAAAALVMLRILWGFAGPHFARFSEFFPTPKRLATYLKEFTAGRERRYLGHNPLGAVMVLFLLALSLGMAVTGFYMTQRGATLFGIERYQLEGVHKLMGNLFVIAVPIHIIGVVFESVRHRENLGMAMIIGRKRAGA